MGALRWGSFVFVRVLVAADELGIDPQGREPVEVGKRSVLSGTLIFEIPEASWVQEDPESEACEDAILCISTSPYANEIIQVFVFENPELTLSDVVTQRRDLTLEEFPGFEARELRTNLGTTGIDAVRHSLARYGPREDSFGAKSPFQVLTVEAPSGIAEFILTGDSDKWMTEFWRNVQYDNETANLLREQRRKRD